MFFKTKLKCTEIICRPDVYKTTIHFKSGKNKTFKCEGDDGKELRNNLLDWFEQPKDDTWGASNNLAEFIIRRSEIEFIESEITINS